MSRVGDVFFTKVRLPKTDVDVIGVCYDDYGHGISVLFASGFYDGFGCIDDGGYNFENGDEVKKFLRYAGHAEQLENYVFKGVIHLDYDFNCGVFNSVLLYRVYDDRVKKDAKTFFYDDSFEDY